MDSLSRRILFIVLPQIIQQMDAKDPKTRSFLAFPYGVLSVATYLKKHAVIPVEIKVLDCNIHNEFTWMGAIKDMVAEFKPGVVALSMLYDSSYQHLESISKLVRENSDAVIILGGSAASFSYQEILEEQGYIDAICYTEGEIPVTDLVSSQDMMGVLGSHKSFITRQSLKVGKIPERSFVENLDEVIDIDYSFVNINDYMMIEAFSPFNTEQTNKKQFFLITSRGCPYSCIFCSTCSGLYANRIRYASIDAIIKHVKRLVDNNGMNVLTIYDDQLLMNRDRAKELFRQLAQFNLRIECPNGLSVAFIDNDLAGLMRKAGMDTIILAIEHGSEKMLKIIHKPFNLKMVKPVVQTLRKHDFFINAFFVIGIPGETEEDREITMKFIKDTGFDWCSFNVATPLRGSRLYDLCVRSGYIPEDLKIGDIRMQDKRYIINAPGGLTPEHITRTTYLMNLEVNFVNNYRMNMGDYPVAASCFRDVINRTSNHAFAYYYLAEAQEAVGLDLLARNKICRFNTIIEKDPIWKGYAEHFGLV